MNKYIKWKNFAFTGRCKDDVIILVGTELKDPNEVKLLKDVDIEDGESISILCYSYRDKKEVVHKDLIMWKKDGKPVSNNIAKKMERDSIEINNKSQYFDYLPLHLKDLKKSDEGVYTCHRSYFGCATFQQTQSSIRLNYIGIMIF